MKITGRMNQHQQIVKKKNALTNMFCINVKKLRNGRKKIVHQVNTVMLRVVQDVYLMHCCVSEKNILKTNYLEKLTSDITKKSWKLMEEVSSQGGMIKAIELGIPKMRIEQAAAKRQARIDSMEETIVGDLIFSMVPYLLNSSTVG